MRKQIITSLFVLVPVVASAQVKVSDFTIARSGDKAEVQFTAKVCNKAVKSNYKLTITPVVSNGGNSGKLTPIIVRGRRRSTMDARNRIKPATESFVAKNGQVIRYRSVVPYVDWLQGANVCLDIESAGCCSKLSLPLYMIAQNITVQGAENSVDKDLLNVCVNGMVLIVGRNAPLPEKDYTVPAMSVTQTKPEELTIDFQVGSARLDPNAYYNYRALNDLVTTLRSSREVLSGKIDITGYASPEGIENVNYELAQNRALAVRNYILDNVPHLRPADFTIINGGENWEGLRKIVEESVMPGRWQVIDIIDHTPPRIDYVNNTSRKKFLMNLNGGQTWNYMLKHFFPQLRSAASVVIYKIEAADKSAASFPASNVEVIDQAIDLIGVRKASEALALLYKVQDDPRAWNPMGVCYILLNNTEKAREYFQKAADAGYSDARMNMDQLK